MLTVNLSIPSRIILFKCPFCTFTAKSLFQFHQGLSLTRLHSRGLVYRKLSIPSRIIIRIDDESYFIKDNKDFQFHQGLSSSLLNHFLEVLYDTFNSIKDYLNLDVNSYYKWYTDLISFNSIKDYQWRNKLSYSPVVAAFNSIKDYLNIFIP